ncbi:hypothetical protein DPEC_G00282410 [Dallia pectoralis]|uniref:Uncharacterized protein n=1 Tax=Dallia pectoralis TaxID=75939 RepID=A0ACC2FN52_DALPE|nr:hypothetical protein DPEC_G00282410 [Dallia pectoralis]
MQRIINTAQRIIGSTLISLKDLYTSRCLSRALKIKKDHFHPGSNLFELLPSGPSSQIGLPPLHPRHSRTITVQAIMEPNPRGTIPGLLQGDNDGLEERVGRACMKDKTSAEIHLEVAKAKVEMLRFLRNGRVLDFKLFKALIDQPDAVKRVVDVLEETGHVFYNKPEVPSVVTEQTEQISANDQHMSQPTVEQETEQGTDSAEDPPLYPLHQMLTKPQPSPKECLSILTVAKPDFMKSIGMLMNGTALKKEEQLNVLYYLDYAEDVSWRGNIFSVVGWCKVSNDHGTIYVIGVKEHKNGAQQVATISLDEEEDAWMDIYYKMIRPAFLQGLLEEQAKSDHFVIEMSTIKGNADDENGLVANYLSHSNATGDAHYHMKTMSSAQMGMDITRD